MAVMYGIDLHVQGVYGCDVWDRFTCTRDISMAVMYGIDLHVQGIYLRL